jgi:hypothetical protein
MNLIENLINSLNYTKKLLDDGGRIIILIILYLIPILNWIVLGYGVRILKEAPNSEVPPKLDGYGGLLIDGAKVFFATSIYMIVPLFLIALGIASLAAGEFFIQQVAGTSLALGGAGVTLVLVGLILAFFALILLGVGIAHMAMTGKFGKAFAFGEIFRIVNVIGKVKYLGWVIITGLIAILLVGLAASVPYIGWLLTAILSPFLATFIFRSLSILYNDGTLPELKMANVSSGMAEIKCATCGAPLQPHHKFCPACGAPAPAPNTVKGARFCIGCGRRIPVTATFCGWCGAKQN